MNEENQQIINGQPVTENTTEVTTQQERSAGVVSDAEESMFDKIRNSTNFQERSEQVFEKAVEAELEKRELIVLSQEQQNELARLKLKLNKKTMKDEAKAEHYERKRKAKMIRYGYLYTPYEVEVIDPESGELKKETRYKNFTTNTFINKYKEFAEFWATLADSTKKIITKTIKIILWSALIVGIGFALYGLIKWLLTSGISTRFIENVQQIINAK